MRTAASSVHEDTLPATESLIAEGTAAAKVLLRRNLTPAGILAATPSPRAEARNYTRVFGRDAAICALGMAVSGEPDLMEGAERGLLTLASHQAHNGQIPKYVDPHGGPDFWYLGCIDATLWWLIAVDFLARHGRPEIARRLEQPVRRALTWVSCQEHPHLGLVQQNEASDWADIMPRSGFVLYSNALWYRVKRIYGVAGADETRFHFNHLFFPFSRELPDYKRLRLLTHFVRRRTGSEGARPEHGAELYLSFVNFATWGEEGDVFGNLLAILCGLASDGPTHRILHALDRAHIDTPVPARAVCSPIAPNSRLWRPYMGRHRQNLEYRYHNGGAWPFIGGFHVLALAGQGRARCRRAVHLPAPSQSRERLGVQRVVPWRERRASGDDGTIVECGDVAARPLRTRVPGLLRIRNACRQTAARKRLSTLLSETCFFSMPAGRAPRPTTGMD